ncbi:MAG: hypothetical protein VX294_02340 [Candidatus Latescibacterota bacterium]|nr:hypothetical protein [Candidatus Latescibacterota bacterium]
MKLTNDEALKLSTFRLHFFLMAFLMAICMLLFWWFQLMELRGWLGPLVVIVVNLLGFILSYTWARPSTKFDSASKSVRVYNIYFRGQRLGAVTRNDFDKLMALNLLKRQQTVELVDDYEAQARNKGVTVSLLSNSEGTERLVKVEE